MEFHTAIKDKYSALYKSFSARILPRKASVLHVLQYLCGSCRIHLHIRCHHHYHDHHDNWKLHATKCNTHYSARPSTFCYVFGKIQSNILSAVCFVKMRSEYSMDDSPIFTILGSLTVVIHHYRTHTHTHMLTLQMQFLPSVSHKNHHIYPTHSRKYRCKIHKKLSARSHYNQPPYKQSTDNKKK